MQRKNPLRLRLIDNPSDMTAFINRRRWRNRVIVFLFFTFILGLLQLHVIAFIELFKSKSVPTLTLLLSDGGLYFFSTSLVISSLYSFWASSPITMDDNLSIATMLCVTTTLIIAIVGYTTGSLMKNPNSNTLPFAHQIHIISQVICIILSGIYSFYVAQRVGLFGEDK